LPRNALRQPGFSDPDLSATRIRYANGLRNFKTPKDDPKDSE